MKMFILTQSKNQKKKYTIIKLEGHDAKRISFGATGFDDYTTSNDEVKKKNYLTRHEPREDWTDTNTAGFWARWLLWNKKTIDSSIKDIEKRFNIKIIKMI